MKIFFYLEYGFYCVPDALEAVIEEMVEDSIIYDYMTDLYEFRNVPIMAIPFTCNTIFLSITNVVKVSGKQFRKVSIGEKWI